ncbi:MAG: anti-sigma factor antagonist [Clostridia bacterium]|nr:anti-sigma factor antagonist [Clostridia bacterium]
MHIYAKFLEKTVYLQLSGEIDEHSAVVTRREADRLVDEYATTCERAVVDLRNVTFMDSTGIGFLIGRYKKFQRFGVPVYIANPSPATDKILSMSGVYTLMQKI